MQNPIEMIGRVAVCRHGIPGVVTEVGESTGDRPMYLGHALLHPGRRWQSVDPRFVTLAQSYALKVAVNRAEEVG